MTSWDELRGTAGRRDLPVILAMNIDDLDPEDLPQALTDAWTMPEWPEQTLSRDLWAMLFEMACGIVVDGEVVPDEDLPQEVVLYRGAIEEHSHGMAWTTDRERAEWFAHRFDGMRGGETGRVYQMTVPREYLLANFTGRGEEEWVVSPEWLDNYEDEVEEAA